MSKFIQKSDLIVSQAQRYTKKKEKPFRLVKITIFKT